MPDILSVLIGNIDIVSAIKDNIIPIIGMVMAGGAGLSWFLYRVALKILPSKKFFDWLGDKIREQLRKMAIKNVESSIATALKIIEACDEIKKDMLYFIDNYKNKKN